MQTLENFVDGAQSLFEKCAESHDYLAQSADG